MHPLHRLWLGACAYGLVRNALVATQIPLKKDELYTRRVGTVIFSSLATPLLLPTLVLEDLENIERKARGIKTQHSVPFI